MEKYYFIDWLAFTVKDIKLSIILEEIFKIKLEQWMPLTMQLYGYQQSCGCNGITVLYNDADGTDQQGVHCILSGNAIKAYNKINSITALLNRIKKYETAKFKRIDLTLDVVNEKMLDFIKNSVFEEKYKTRYKKYTIIQEFNTKTGGKTAETFYFGSRKSENMVRVYDKAAEQKIEADICRIEIELKKNSAHKVALDISKEEDIQVIVNGILKNNLNFLEEKRKKNTARNHISKKWKTVIDYDATAIYRSATEKEETSLTAKADWLYKQISRTYAMCKNTNLLTEKEILEYGYSKLTDIDFITMAEILKEQTSRK